MAELEGNDKRGFHTTAGEHLVLGELLKRHIEAYLAIGPSNASWDIAAVTTCGEHRVRVQVKAIDWPRLKAIQLKPTTDFDVLVIVLLNSPYPSEFLVIPKYELSRVMKENPTMRGIGKHQITTLSVSARYAEESFPPFALYKDAWHHIARYDLANQQS
jgi:hypothetical protein